MSLRAETSPAPLDVKDCPHDGVEADSPVAGADVVANDSAGGTADVGVAPDVWAQDVSGPLAAEIEDEKPEETEPRADKRPIPRDTPEKHRGTQGETGAAIVPAPVLGEGDGKIIDKVEPPAGDASVETTKDEPVDDGPVKVNVGHIEDGSPDSVGPSVVVPKLEE